MITFSCSGCGASFRVSDDKAGGKGKCPKCGNPFTVPVKTPSPPETEDSPDQPQMASSSPSPATVKRRTLAFLVGGVTALVVIGVLLAVFFSRSKGGNHDSSNGGGSSGDVSYMPALFLSDGGPPNADDREAAFQAMQFWRMMKFFTPGENELTVRTRYLTEAYQYKEPRLAVSRQPLTDVDKMNSIEWYGSVKLTGKGIRKAQGGGYINDLALCKWSEWGSPDSVPTLSVAIQKRAGNWGVFKEQMDGFVSKREFADIKEVMRLFKEASSKTNIANIGKAIAVYTGSYSDRWPPDLGFLVRDNQSPGLFVSPYSNRPPPNLVNRQLIGETDYIYVPLDSQADSGLIAAYERPENTEGKKVLVLYQDLHVGEYTDIAAFNELLKRSNDYAKSKSKR